MAPPFRLSFAARLAVAAIVLSLLLPGSLGGAASRASRLSEASVVPVSAPLPAADVAHRLSAEVYGYLPYWEIDDGTDAYLRYNLLTDICPVLGDVHADRRDRHIGARLQHGDRRACKHDR